MAQPVIIAKTRGYKVNQRLKFEPETHRLFQMMGAKLRQKYGLNEALAKEWVVTYLVLRDLQMVKLKPIVSASFPSGIPLKPIKHGFFTKPTKGPK